MERLGRHIGSTPLAVVELDYGPGHPGKISTWSGQAQPIFGWHAAEALGRTLDELGLIHAEDEGRRSAAYRSIRDDGVNTAEITMRAWTKDRRLLHCTAHVSVVRRPDGSIETILMLIEDVTARLAAQAEVTRLAHHDALTGLPNRTLFGDRLKQALSRSKRDGDRVGLMLIDLDHFKQVNDVHGHWCGDELLRHVARRLTASVRESDSLARLGGDEFALLQVAVADAHAAELLASRIVEALALPNTLDGHVVDISCSIGVALFPDDGGDDEALFRAADVALYRAKTKGRNRFVLYRREMDAELSTIRSLQARLTTALAEGSLSLVYQPVAALPDRKIARVEALCRWRDQDGTWIPPSAFVPLAADCGLLHALGDWTRQMACAQAAAWSAAGSPVILAVNVAVAELERPGFTDSILGILAETGLDPCLLQLELSEQVFDDASRETAIPVLRAIREIGVTIAIDNFGAGACPLARLHELPFDEVKIATSFIGGIERSQALAALTRSIVQLAQALGKRATAERVETEGQLRLACTMGFDAVQGYLISPPLSADELRQHLGTADVA